MATRNQEMIVTDVVSLGEISTHEYFGGLARFVIPSIQRDYQWGIGDDSKQIDDSAFAFINDLIQFHQLRSEDEPYFLGTMIVYSDESDGDEINVMDGQQRWTTLTALMGVIYHLFDNGADENWTDVKESMRSKFLYYNEGPLLLSKNEVDNRIIEQIIHFNGDVAINEIYSGPQERHATFRRNGVTYKGVNLNCVVQYFLNKLKEEFDIKGPLDSRRNLLSFLDSLTNDVKVNLTYTPRSNLAYKMFITANARGTHLNNFDILRGLVLARNQMLGLQNHDWYDQHFEVTSDNLDQICGNVDNRSPIIDKTIADALTIYTGNKVEKTSAFGILEREINRLQNEGELRNFVRHFERFIFWWLKMKNNTTLPGMVENCRLSYYSSKDSQHLVLYVAALMAWVTDPSEINRLMRIIECFSLRSHVLGGRTRPSTLAFYQIVPRIGHRILN